jgi:hypothetical protein
MVTTEEKIQKTKSRLFRLFRKFRFFRVDRLTDNLTPYFPLSTRVERGQGERSKKLVYHPDQDYYRYDRIYYH